VEFFSKYVHTTYINAPKKKTKDTYDFKRQEATFRYKRKRSQLFLPTRSLAPSFAPSIARSLETKKKRKTDMQSIVPHVYEDATAARVHLQEHGWTVVRIMDEEKAHTYRNDILYELEMYGQNQPPRTMGGMIKTHKMNMSRTLHRVRHDARAMFFHILSGEDPSNVVFSLPTNENELSCNPDAVYVSSGKPAELPRTTHPSHFRDNLWWHVDTDTSPSFLQGSVVLDNPFGSEEFCVMDKSHMHFTPFSPDDDCGTGGFRLFADKDIDVMSSTCPQISMRVPPGCLVLWYSTTVHTVKPVQEDLYTDPRVLVYVSYGTTKDLDKEDQCELRFTKALAVMFAACCRHMCYPCEVAWQSGRGTYTRDYLTYDEFVEKMPWIFGTRPGDYNDNELSIYGLTLQDIRDTIMYCSDYWEYDMSSWEKLEL
jgi:hypothetical protein